MGIVSSIISELLTGAQYNKSYQPGFPNVSQRNISFAGPPNTPPVTRARTTAETIPETEPAPIVDEKTANPESETAVKNPLLFEMTSDQMLRGIILSEILGKPVSKRNGFGRPR